MNLRRATVTEPLPRLRGALAILRGMLNAVLELELVTVDFVPIVSLRHARVAAWRLVRRAQTELLRGLPAVTEERLVALAREQGRAGCLERLWQKVSVERVARFGPIEPVLIPVDPSALDARWSATSLRRVARAHDVDTPLVLELSDANGMGRAAAEARMAGFGVASRGDAWRDAKPHWRLVTCEAALSDDRPSALAAEAFAVDARLVVEGVTHGEQLRALRAAGVDLVTGPALGRARERPHVLDTSLVAALRASELGLRERLSFGRRYEPDDAFVWA